jgi:hypothetical protein
MARMRTPGVIPRPDCVVKTFEPVPIANDVVDVHA